MLEWNRVNRNDRLWFAWSTDFCPLMIQASSTGCSGDVFPAAWHRGDNDRQVLVMPFSVVSLTISGMNCNPEMQGTPVRRDFLPGLKQLDPLLVRTFEAGRLTPLIRILGREVTPLIWMTPSVRSLYRSIEEGMFLFACLSSPCQHMHSFTDIGAYFFGIPTQAENQLRLQPYGTEHTAQSL